MSIWILIPAYNEGRNLGRVIADVRAAGWKNILVVDDGSTDDTSAVATRHKAELIRLEHNRGQGAALQAGIEHLKRTHTPDVIVTFDADGQHRASDIKALVEALQAHCADVALGSRFLQPASRVPLWRKFLLKLLISYTRWTTQLPVTDAHNGLRALTRKAYQTINLTWPRRAHASQILHQISRAKLRYVEVPVTIVYE